VLFLFANNFMEEQMAKPKVAFYWCASCGGCEEAIVDLNADLLKVAELVDIVFWPCAMDFKYSDVKKMRENEITISFINGAIRNDEQEEMVKILREKSQIVIAFGACSQLGGIPGLANFWDKESIFKTSYGQDRPFIDNPDFVVPQTVSQVPEGELTLPEFHDSVKSLDQVIAVEYYIPGCAPPPYLTLKAIETALAGELPEVGSVISPRKALCETCSRSESKPEKISINKINRVSLVEVDPEECLLAQGIICMGPVTRSGCDENGYGRCIEVNMPCRGCFGPTPEIKDVGARMISALSSIVGLQDEENISKEKTEKILGDCLDPAGTFYRFSMATSLLRRKMKGDLKKENN
jgi:F420-non-reducing hydrogenase small subunit